MTFFETIDFGGVNYHRISWFIQGLLLDRGWAWRLLTVPDAICLNMTWVCVPWRTHPSRSSQVQNSATPPPPETIAEHTDRKRKIRREGWGGWREWESGRETLFYLYTLHCLITWPSRLYIYIVFFLYKYYIYETRSVEMSFCCNLKCPYYHLILFKLSRDIGSQADME